MKRKRSNESVVKYTVVFFDICSSTLLINDLLQSRNVNFYAELLIALRAFLEQEKQALVDMQIHKFLGDGWVLLFPDGTDGSAIMRLLVGLCKTYDANFESLVAGQLLTIPKLTGLTFGADFGEIVKLDMFEHEEYIGQPLNLAARLQNAVKTGNDAPEYTLLLSNRAVTALKMKKSSMTKVSRSLANFLGGAPVDCFSVKLYAVQP